MEESEERENQEEKEEINEETKENKESEAKKEEKEEKKPEEELGKEPSPKQVHETHTSHKSNKTKNPWVVSTLILGVVVVAFLVIVFSKGGITGNVISENNAGEIVMDFANSQVEEEVELVEINERYGLYEVIISINGENLPVYLSKDGKNLIHGVTPLSVFSDEAETTTQETQSTEVPKSDKPKVELFVMTHCPFGTQAEKGFIPTLKALGDLIDGKIRFVHYFMHAPEETETPIQVCIREEQSDKYLDYLECFLEDGNSSRCLEEVGVDEDKLQTCIDNGKADEYYEVDSSLSESYGVRGSPTLVINGVIASSGRNSDAYLQTICSAFNTVPEKCSSLALSTSNPNPGFGYGEGETAATDAQC